MPDVVKIAAQHGFKTTGRVGLEKLPRYSMLAVREAFDYSVELIHVFEEKSLCQLEIDVEDGTSLYSAAPKLGEIFDLIKSNRSSHFFQYISNGLYLVISSAHAKNVEELVAFMHKKINSDAVLNERFQRILRKMPIEDFIDEDVVFE